jgi:radical SAM superfamily enzyme YgiQ (UPF0313 family)
MSQLKVFLSDLNYTNHEGKEWTITPFPLNAAYIAAFMQKMFPDVFQVSIFKKPEDLLDAIRSETPAIAAFSNYIWNKNLHLQFAKYVKQQYPDCITVMGGPNYNFKELAWIDNFARANPQIDFHIEGEGEAKFANLVACAVAHQLDLDAIRSARPAGATYLDPQLDSLISTGFSATGTWMGIKDIRLDRESGRLIDLNDIPSPYLAGLLDKYLDDPNYCPIIETNRGCPYRCTFCNWGDMGKSKSSVFSSDRVEAELRYIAKRNVSKTPYLYVGDANFGLFQRDVDLAKLLRELKDTTGFPQNVYMYFAKNSSEKVIRIAEILKDMTRISLSRQTQNDEVLKIIRRSNIGMDTFNRLAELAKSLGVESFVELIYGLPGESKASFFAGAKEVMRQRFDGIHMFPAMLLDGSEMGTQESRDQYGLKGEWRKIDGCAGAYGPVMAMEYEEIITESNVMSRDDYFEIRLFHFFQNLFVDTKIYKDVEVLLGERSFFDLIADVIANYRTGPELVQALIGNFLNDAKSEMLAVPPKQFTKEMIEVTRGSLVKLNPLYVCKLLYEPGMRSAFNAFVKRLILNYDSSSEREIDGVLAYIDASIYPFDGSNEKTVFLDIDAVGFSNRSLSPEGTWKHCLASKPREYVYTKNTTYNQFIDEFPIEQPLANMIYEVVLHHAHEILGKAVTWSLRCEKSDSDNQGSVISMDENDMSSQRKIQTENGWVY